MSTSTPSAFAEGRQLWTDLQMAETLLFQAAAVTHREGMRTLFDGIDVEGPCRDLMIRAGSGFPTEGFRPEDYVVRYPFSNAEAIRAILEELVELGFATLEAGAYAWTDRGIDAVRIWMDRVASMMSDLDLGDLASDDIVDLLRFDRQVIEALAESEPPHGSPSLQFRFQGIRPPAEASPALWHHWQHVWTILAASEDEEESVRRKRSIDPLTWFLRRQLWFIDRRPWRARARTLEGLAARAVGYAPFDQPQAACAATLEPLIEAGDVEERNGDLRLTEAGLAACDRDESEVDARLLDRWPKWTADETRRLREVLDRLNGRLLERIRAGQGERR